MLENANLKLSTVFSDVFGRTSWTIICKIVTGETNTKVLTSNIHHSCKSSKETIQKALHGTLEEEDRNILKRMIEHVEA
jgi:transposase